MSFVPFALCCWRFPASIQSKKVGDIRVHHIENNKTEKMPKVGRRMRHDFHRYFPQRTKTEQRKGSIAFPLRSQVTVVAAQIKSRIKYVQLKSRELLFFLTFLYVYCSFSVFVDSALSKNAVTYSTFGVFPTEFSL